MSRPAQAGREQVSPPQLPKIKFMENCPGRPMWPPVKTGKGCHTFKLKSPQGWKGQANGLALASGHRARIGGRWAGATVEGVTVGLSKQALKPHVPASTPPVPLLRGLSSSLTCAVPHSNDLEDEASNTTDLMGSSGKRNDELT